MRTCAGCGKPCPGDAAIYRGAEVDYYCHDGEGESCYMLATREARRWPWLRSPSGPV